MTPEAIFRKYESRIVGGTLTITAKDYAEMSCRSYHGDGDPTVLTGLRDKYPGLRVIIQ